MFVSTLSTLREIKLDLNTDLNHDFCVTDKNLNKAIIKTLAFFNIFDYPLTDWEIYKYLWVKDLNKKKYNYGEIKNALNNIYSIEQREGFYFLQGKSDLVATRKQRQIISKKKYQRALWIIKVLSLLPFTKMIAVCNTLAYDNVRDDSDIDLFIVTAKNKIWTTRFYVATLLKILHLRPTAENKKNKICLNFFITRDNLNLQPLMIEDDVYFTYWFKQVLPVYNDKIFSKLMTENIVIKNNINNEELPGFFNKRKVRQGIMAQGFKSMLEVINSWEWLEKLLKFIQMKVMPRVLLDKVGQGSGVVINDQVLKFHVDDKREEFREEWKQVVSSKL